MKRRRKLERQPREHIPLLTTMYLEFHQSDAKTTCVADYSINRWQFCITTTLTGTFTATPIRWYGDLVFRFNSMEDNSQKLGLIWLPCLNGDAHKNISLRFIHKFPKLPFQQNLYTWSEIMTPMIILFHKMQLAGRLRSRLTQFNKMPVSTAECRTPPTTGLESL